MLLCVVLVFMIGIMLGAYVSVDMVLWLIPAGASVLLILAALLRHKSVRPVYCLPLAFALGAFLCAGQLAALDAWDMEDGSQVEVTGKVMQSEKTDGGWRILLQVDTVNGYEKDCADIYVYGEGAMPAGGSEIRAVGQVFSLQPYGNANAFDYREYMRQQGIAGAVSTMFTGQVTRLEDAPDFWPGNITLWLRESFDEAAQWLTEQQKALVYGIFLGEKSGMEYEMKNALGLSGALHAFAVSGLHVGYIVALALLIAGSSYLRRTVRFFLCLAMLALYIGMTGPSPSVIRASVMALCLLFAFMISEDNDSPTALAAAAFLCLLAQPLWLFSAGFQLSFAAAGGILLLYPMFVRLLHKLPHGIVSFLAVTLGATIATLPLICYYFHHISWWGWLLSPVVIAAAGVVVIMSFAATLIAIFSPCSPGFSCRRQHIRQNLSMSCALCFPIIWHR